MALDQLTAACLAESCSFRASGRVRPGDRTGMSPADAARLNEASTRHLQHLVDELHRTEPRPERTYELRTTGSALLQGIRHALLLCTDLRVVYAEAGARDGVTMLVAFPHGALDVQNELMKVTPELRMGPPAVLVWPRIAGEDDEMDVGVRFVMAEPSPRLRELMDRLRTRGQPAIRLVAPYLPAPSPAVAPPGWYADPRGRHDHRWWDGAAWTADAADAGVAITDPL